MLFHFFLLPLTFSHSVSNSRVCLYMQSHIIFHVCFYISHLYLLTEASQSCLAHFRVPLLSLGSDRGQRQRQESDIQYTDNHQITHM